MRQDNTPCPGPVYGMASSSPEPAPTGQVRSIPPVSGPGLRVSEQHWLVMLCGGRSCCCCHHGELTFLWQHITLALEWPTQN